MQIILFGASGRLGTAIQRVLPHHSYLTPSGADVDLTNETAVAKFIDENTADVIVNCAAYNDVNGAETNPNLADALNGYGPGFIAKAASIKQIPIVHFSTDYVFDGIKREGYVETDLPNPESAYARSKLLGETEVFKNNSRSYIIRTSRLYGLPATDPKAKKSFVEIVIDLAKEKSAFDINDNEVSAPTLVDDIARHLEQFIFTFPEPGIYHMSNQGGCTWFEWAKAVGEILKLSSDITPRALSAAPAPIKKPAYSILLSTKIPPMRPWRAALEDFLLHQYVR